MTFSEIKQKLSEYSVGIAGCGGLGSNCALSLARVGVGQLVIADFDTIVESNLNRQYFFYDQIGTKKSTALKTNIERAAPSCRVIAHDLKIDRELVSQLFYGCQVIVEAFDRADMKKMLIETVLEFFPDKLIVSASGLAGWEEMDQIKTVQYGNLIMCGDDSTEVSDELPPLSPKVSVVANLQANAVISYLLAQ